MTTTIDPRIALMARLNTPPYDEAAGMRGTPLDEAAQILDAYRAAELRDFLWRLGQSSGDQVAAKLVEDNPDLAELLNATEARQDLFTGPQWETYDPEAEERERDIQRKA